MAKLIDLEIRVATLVRAAPERVYDGIATAAGLDGWFTTGATVDARPGGEIRLRWKNWGPDRVTLEDGGPVLEARRPERFVFQWSPDDSSYLIPVEIDFEPCDEGTVIRVRQHGHRDTPNGWQTLIQCASGWGEALTLWKFYVEHGIRY
jgi:uncharacterized protein YndB with AHSA1/START domain